MKRNFLFAKIHQARVTHADINYEGSFAIDEEILELSTIKKMNKFRSKILTMPQCAHLVTPGDRVIICSYALMKKHDGRILSPLLLFSMRKIINGNIYSAKFNVF